MSINLAKMSFEDKDYNTYGSSKLSYQEFNILEEWYQKFSKKYKKVASII